MDSDSVYKIALSLTPGVTAEVVRSLEAIGISLCDFFTFSLSELMAKSGGSLRYEENLRQQALFRARRELEFVNSHSIQVYFLLDENYPILLREIPDAPVVIYKLGRADLNQTPAFNVVGTRRCTNYGVNFTKFLISELSKYYPDALVVSGLAYGIDAAAHMAALEYNLPTVAVVAHGLDMIYPAPHRDLARRILEAGGAIVSEYPSGVRPFQKNFLARNRIVAGLCELTVVAESDIRGGALSTANYAFSYSREVIALPGRYTDTTSAGCNKLISQEKAHIFSDVPELMKLMRWPIPGLGTPPAQITRCLFPELEGDQANVYSYLNEKRQPMSADEIHVGTQMSMPALMAALTELEFDGVIVKLPGARYDLA